MGQPPTGIVTADNERHHRHWETELDFVRTSLAPFRWNALNLLVFPFLSIAAMYREKPSDLVRWKKKRPRLFSSDAFGAGCFSPRFDSRSHPRFSFHGSFSDPPVDCRAARFGWDEPRSASGHGGWIPLGKTSLIGRTTAIAEHEFMPIAALSSKSQVVLPQLVRSKLHLAPGAKDDQKVSD